MYVNACTYVIIW